jgi:integrase/recombinase XerC
LDYITVNYDSKLNLIQILSLLTLDDYRKYLSYKIKERKCKVSTNARTISALKCFFQFLENGNYIEENSIKKLKFPKLPKLLPKSLEEEEVVNLIETLSLPKAQNDRSENWKNLRNEALAFLIYSSGLRISEGLSLNKKDFSKNSGFLKVIGKGGKDRFVPILEEAKEKIREYLNSLPVSLLPDYPLFITEKRNKKTGVPNRLKPREFQKAIQEARNTLNLPSFTTPHSLRHSFATHIIKNGGNIRNMQGLLGHSSLSTTQKYVKVDNNLLTDSYKKFHPKG